jgi:hypothetical protein
MSYRFYEAKRGVWVYDKGMKKSAVKYFIFRPRSFDCALLRPRPLGGAAMQRPELGG